MDSNATKPKRDRTKRNAKGERSTHGRVRGIVLWDNAVDTSVFYGRETGLAQLWQWIMAEGCRVVGLLGIGGIGKSTIAVKSALGMQAEFEIVMWRSLSNAPPLEELLSNLLKFLMPIQGEDPVIPATLDEKLILLMSICDRSDVC
ncbi:NB-ARC domain-containing protein [Nostoc sp. NZL]|uniref:NB-ARC domain-containing protein n=1 Tax=Nostoc sp. NZL TaxID=2650612 RepID=UPI001E54314B|nr:NB-ARC domain-containing protein [Nostoc sp. NZL]